MTYTAQITTIRNLHGKGFLAPTDTLSPATLIALRRLAIDAGMSPECAALARPTDLIRIFACAASANAHLTPQVAASMALLIAKRGGAPVSPATPSPIMPATPEPDAAPESVQTLPSAPSDLSPIMAQLDAMRAVMNAQAARLAKQEEELDALKASKPTTIEITYPDTISNPVVIANVHPIFPKVLHFLKNRKNLFVWGPRGSGKTHLGGQAAEALGLPLYATGPIKNISRLLGYVNPFNGEYHGTDFRKAFEHGGVFCADEVASGDEEVLLELNMALANKYFPFPDGIVFKHKDFVLMACDNTNGAGGTDEYNGRNKLDDSFMDRFAVLKMEYDETIETALATNKAWAAHVQRFRALATREGVRIPSPRATYNGSDMINDGLSWEDAEDAYLYVQMDELDTNRMRALMALEAN